MNDIDADGRYEDGTIGCEACAAQYDEAVADMQEATNRLVEAQSRVGRSIEQAQQLHVADEQSERERSCAAWNQRRKQEIRRKVEATRVPDDAVIVAARREAAVLQSMGVQRIAPTGNILHALDIVVARREAQ